MKKDKRTVYLELTSEIGWNLCPFCLHNKSEGSLCDSWQECHHPLDRVAELNEMGLESGEDCWGFRSEYPLSDIADMVGIVLSQRFDPEKTFFYADSTGKYIEQVIGTTL